MLSFTQKALVVIDVARLCGGLRYVHDNNLQGKGKWNVLQLGLRRKQKNNNKYCQLLSMSLWVAFLSQSPYESCHILGITFFPTKSRITVGEH